jgi:multidrug efflux pump subunit AcrA (membrane-fusion protein)
VEVIEIMSDHELEAEMRLPEAHFAGIVEGETVISLSSPLLEGLLALPVTRVISAIDPQEGVFAFRVAIPPERRQRLVPGAFLQGEVAVGAGKSAVIVPIAAIVHEGGRAFAFVARDGLMVKTPVVTGDRMTDSIVVRGGLGPEDRVVVGPPAELRDGAPLPAGRRSN